MARPIGQAPWLLQHLLHYFPKSQIALWVVGGVEIFGWFNWVSDLLELLLILIQLLALSRLWVQDFMHGLWVGSFTVVITCDRRY